MKINLKTSVKRQTIPPCYNVLWNFIVVDDALSSNPGAALIADWPLIRTDFETRLCRCTSYSDYKSFKDKDEAFLCASSSVGPPVSPPCLHSSTRRPCSGFPRWAQPLAEHADHHGRAGEEEPHRHDSSSWPVPVGQIQRQQGCHQIQFHGVQGEICWQRNRKKWLLASSKNFKF